MPNVLISGSAHRYVFVARWKCNSWRSVCAVSSVGLFSSNRASASSSNREDGETARQVAQVATAPSKMKESMNRFTVSSPRGRFVRAARLALQRCRVTPE